MKKFFHAVHIQYRWDRNSLIIIFYRHELNLRLSCIEFDQNIEYLWYRKDWVTDEQIFCLFETTRIVDFFHNFFHLVCFVTRLPIEMARKKKKNSHLATWNAILANIIYDGKQSEWKAHKKAKKNKRETSTLTSRQPNWILWMLIELFRVLIL